MKIFLFPLVLSMIALKAVSMTVHDPQTCAQAIRQLHQTASHYSREITHWQEQIHYLDVQNGLLKEELASLTGLRELSDIEGELSALIMELKDLEKHREALNALLRSSNEQESTYANEILNKYRMFDVCKEKGNQKLDHICKEQILNKAATLEVGEKIRKQTERKVMETSRIAAKVKNTKDMKESQDLANVIALKDMEITQLRNQWDGFVSESRLRDKLIEQKRREAFDDHQINAPIPTF